MIPMPMAELILGAAVAGVFRLTVRRLLGPRRKPGQRQVVFDIFTVGYMTFPLPPTWPLLGWCVYFTVTDIWRYAHDDDDDWRHRYREKAKATLRKFAPSVLAPQPVAASRYQFMVRP